MRRNRTDLGHLVRFQNRDVGYRVPHLPNLQRKRKNIRIHIGYVFSSILLEFCRLFLGTVRSGLCYNRIQVEHESMGEGREGDAFLVQSYVLCVALSRRQKEVGEVDNSLKPDIYIDIGSCHRDPLNIPTDPNNRPKRLYRLASWNNIDGSHRHLLVSKLRSSTWNSKRTPRSFLKRCVKCGKMIPIASEECQHCGIRQPEYIHE